MTVGRLRTYLEQDIWRVRGRRLPRQKLWLFKGLRVLLLAGRGFTEDQCQLRASALTFYTLLSVVPVLAMAFGIAKGFNLQGNLETILAERLRGQEQVAAWLIQFANNFLQNTQGGVVAGAGVALLFWSVVNVLGNIEQSFNEIWGVRTGRPFSRKLTDYLSVMLVAPILLMVSSGATVFLASQVQRLTERFALLGHFSGAVLVLLGGLPYLVLWVLFTCLYMFMPNTRVSFRAAFTAGILAGTTYQFVQLLYVFFQIGVSRFNAVYGGFAALPLFLTWLQTSWLVVLFGAEVSFAVDNEETYEFEHDCRNASRRFKLLVALAIVDRCVKPFEQRLGPVEARDIAHALEAPIRLVRELLFDLTQAGLLTTVKVEGRDGENYQPGIPTDRLRVSDVRAALERHGQDYAEMIDADVLRPFGERLDALDRRLSDAPENVLIRDL